MPIKPKFDEQAIYEGRDPYAVALTFDQLKPETKQQLRDEFGPDQRPQKVLKNKKGESTTFEQWLDAGGLEAYIENRLGSTTLQEWAPTTFSDKMFKEQTGKSVDFSSPENYKEFLNFVLPRRSKEEERLLEFEYKGGGSPIRSHESIDAIMLKRLMNDPSEQNKRRIFDYLQPGNSEEIPAS